jgi:hypothetical protein
MRSSGMFASLPQPPTRPCADCGAAVPQAELDAHVCEQERWVDHQMFLLRGELDQLEHEIAVWLDSPCGRFELAYAERDRTSRRA